jgi:hypothetical protein
VLGQLVYRLNVNAPVIRMMARGHVYVDPNWLKGERFAQKLSVVRATGARHGSIRFVTGMLDLMRSRSDFLEAARRFTEPILSWPHRSRRDCGSTRRPKKRREAVLNFDPSGLGGYIVLLDGRTIVRNQ